MLRPIRVLGLLLALLVPSTVSKPETALRVASGGKTIRVMTYNIHVGIGMDKKLDLPRIAEVIKSQHADLVGLQEVDRGVTRTGQVDEIAELARLRIHKKQTSR